MATLQRHRCKVKLFQAAMSLATKLANLPNRITPAPFRLVQMGSAYWQSRALHAAAELGIADALGDGQQSTAELAQTLALHEDHLYRLMRMLAALGVFEECQTRHFRNNGLSGHLRSDHPQSIRALIRLHNSRELSQAWFESLIPALRNGSVPFELSHGATLFDHMDNQPDFDSLFTQAMEAVEGITGTDYLMDFDWSAFERIIDVGGSNGKKTNAILQRQPKLQAVVFDRPAVVSEASERWRSTLPADLLERLSFCGGDMRRTIPKAQSDNDLYLFFAIFHGMGSADALQVLSSLRQACGDYRPTVVIADMVVAERNIDTTSAGFDMQMLVNTQGRERTLAEWHDLLNRGGFDICEVVEVRTLTRFLVARVAG